MFDALELTREVIRLTNERSGTTLWSGEYAYGATLAARVPRLAAVQSSMVVRCGLFGASTYPKALPDNALIPYLGFSEAVSTGLGSVKANLQLLRNAVFPIEFVPVKHVLAAMVGLASSLAILIISSIDLCAAAINVGRDRLVRRREQA